MIDEAAWNNFVLYSNPATHAKGTDKRAAAIANFFMGTANNGGLNSFLTCSYDYDADEIVGALGVIGATKAAEQLKRILSGLGTCVRASTQEARWVLLDTFWTDELDRYDILDEEADTEMLQALQRHVEDNKAFYLESGGAN